MDEKIIKIFSELLNIPESYIKDDDSYNSLKGWDSLKHLEIVSRLEKDFNIDIEMDDVIAMDSVKRVKDIIKKYIHK